MSGGIKVEGDWKDFQTGFVKFMDNWIHIESGFIKQGGQWVRIYNNTAPPVILGNNFAELGDIVMTTEDVLYNYEGTPTNDLLTTNGAAYNPAAYADLFSFLGSDPLPWTSLEEFNSNWIDSGNGLETVELGGGEKATLVLAIPLDTTCGVRVSSEAIYDVFKVTSGIGNVIWEGSGEMSEELTLLAAESPYTFEYEKDNDEDGGSDMAWIDYLTDIYPMVTVPFLPVKNPEDGSLGVPYKIVADYTGGA